jgi:hypothetical protein
MLTTKHTSQVEHDLRAEMTGMTLAQVCDFARAMGVQDGVCHRGSIDEIKDECVRLELHAFVH